MATGTPVQPLPKTIRVIQDKYLQKVYLQSKVGQFKLGINRRVRPNSVPSGPATHLAAKQKGRAESNQSID